MRPKKLPYKKFLESFKYAPRPAVNLLVIREDGAILLTKRKKPPFAGSWHLPGSFVLKGESLMDCVNRVAKEELGIEIDPTSPHPSRKVSEGEAKLRGARIEKKSIQLAGAFDDLIGDPRGHAVDLVYRCRIKSGKIGPVGDTAVVRFFKKLPKNIGFNHAETLNALGYRDESVE